MKVKHDVTIKLTHNEAREIYYELDNLSLSREEKLSKFRAILGEALDT